MGKFADGVTRYRLKVEQLSLQGFRKVVLDLDTKVVERTPVDTGRARANWQANIGPQPQSQGGDIATTVAALTLGDTAWLANGLPYIRVLEYGEFPNPPKGGTGKTVGGFSTQAPSGMIRLSALEFGDIVEQAT